MLLHTILSLKQTLYLQKQGEKEMFEIRMSGRTNSSPGFLPCSRKCGN